MDLKEFDALLHDAEVKMKRLKALYEQWFQGIERIEPSVPRKDLERLFALLARNKPRNTAARFRLSQLTARYGIYLTYWGRIARQIEEGTYKRDLRRAARGRGMAQTTSAKAYELDLDEEIELEEIGLEEQVEERVEPRDEFARMLGDLESPAAAKPKPVLSAFSPFARKPKSAPGSAPEPPSASGAELARPKEPRRPPPPPSTGKRPALPAKPPAPPVAATFGKPKPTTAADEPNLRNLYDRYVDARRRNNENADSVAYDKLARSVRQMTSKLRERHGDKKIDFEVVVQNGKVGIKPKVG